MRYGHTSRAQSEKAGRRLYFTGERCEAGHRAERVTATGACAECERLAIAEANATAFKARLERRIAADAIARRERIAARRAEGEQAARRSPFEHFAPSSDDVKPLSCAQVERRKRGAAGKGKSASPFDDVTVIDRNLIDEFDRLECELEEAA